MAPATRGTKSKTGNNNHTSESAKKKAKTNSEKEVDIRMEERAINVIRAFTADVVQKANSGHPGMPMGCAPMAFVLFTKVMNFNPANPNWSNRDRFVLSNGHGCALLYTMLHLTGYSRPTLSDLQNFRQLDSVTPGHPENFLLPGVEVTTGPLGQGISNAVGLAIAEKHLAATYNFANEDKIVDNYTFVICGDGCLQEGISSEASSLAGHLKLGKLIVLYDANNITIDGETDLSFSEDVGKRYEAYGWQVLKVKNGNADVEDILKKVEIAKKNDKQPTMIIITTIIGFGSKNEGTEGVHGSPLGEDDIIQLKKKFGLDETKKFWIPDDIKEYMLKAVEKGRIAEENWSTMYQNYAKKHPDQAAELERRMARKLPAKFEETLAEIKFSVNDKPTATRNSSGQILNVLADMLPELIGGSADLTPSTKTQLKCTGDFEADTPQNRYLRFGVREHGMAAICNGLTAYNGLIPFGATFLNFAGYALGAIRLSALSHFRVLYIMTHDSIGLGEDGPTHQPVEILAALRATPNLFVFRPCDANEVKGCYKVAIESLKTPSLFALSRQDVPVLAGSDSDKVKLGAYCLNDGEKANAKVILLGTGSEVCILVEAKKLLKEKNGIESLIVSMPCMELFDAQDDSYKAQVFPEGLPVLSLEASSKFGWERYAHCVMGLTTFGKSAPYKDIYEHFGFTAEGVTEKAIKLIDFYKERKVPHLAVLPKF